MKKIKLIGLAGCIAICGILQANNVWADTDPNNSNEIVQNKSKTDASDNPSSQKQAAKTEQVAKAGWKIENNKKYYYVNNQKLTGYQKINGNHYLFSKKGVMKVGLQKPAHKSYRYFLKSGKQAKKNVSTNKAYYWVSRKGKIGGIKNKAKVICQRPEMPTGCEITAVTMMINFAGKKVSKFQAAKVMKRSSNPNKGFIGSPYKKWPLGYWVAPKGVKSVVKHYLGKNKVMTGCSMKAIKNKLLHSHLVVAWVGMFDGFPNHAIALTGYHKGKIYYNDPWTGTKRVMRQSIFKKHWAFDAYRALSY